MHDWAMDAQMDTSRTGQVGFSDRRWTRGGVQRAGGPGTAPEAFSFLYYNPWQESTLYMQDLLGATWGVARSWAWWAAAPLTPPMGPDPETRQ